MSLKLRPTVTISLIVLALLILQVVLQGNGVVNAESVPTDNDGEELFPLVGSFSNASFFSSAMSISKEVMVKDDTHQYLIYIEDDPQMGKSVYLTRSLLGNYSWEEPLRIWEQGDVYGIRPGLLISNGTIFAFIAHKEETAWTTWRFYCKEIPVSNWRNTSLHQLVRLDDTLQGYTSSFAAIDFNGEIYIFWTRSHHMSCVYRIRDADGDWSGTKYVDPSNYFSKISVIKRTVGDTDLLYLYYQYYPANRVYLTTSTDGVTWSSRTEVLYLADEPGRFEVQYFNDRYHMAIGENQDHDVYYTSSINGITWDPLKYIGALRETANTPGFPDKMNVVLATSVDSGNIYIAYDHAEGIAIHSSSNNGSTFSSAELFDDDGYHQPTFDSWGQHIVMTLGDELEVRSLTQIETTIPDDPPGNDTDPDEEYDGPYPEVGSFSKVNFTTTFTSTWEEMGKDETHEYVIYTGEDSLYGKSVYISRSPLGNHSWEEPLRIWDQGDFYGINPGIYISNGTIFAFIIQKVTQEWTTWSYYCKEIPISDWRDTSKHKVVRLDDTLSGYIQSSNYIEFNGELYVFWTRSHFVEGVYRSRSVDGTWSTTKFVDPSVNIAVGSVIKRNIGGNDLLYYYYQYYHEDRIYLYTTEDGNNWSDRIEVLYLPDSPDVFEIVHFNNKYHMAVGERFGTDVYYLSSINGINWSTPRWIGVRSDISDRTEFPFRSNVALTASVESGEMYITYDHDKGAALHISKDNGSSFSLVDVFEGKWFQFPTFDHWGGHLLYMDGDYLRIRSLGYLASPEDPPGNDTDPEDPPGNDTDPEDPPGNDTDPDDPPGNDTDPEDPPGNDTNPDDLPGNDTDPDDPPGNDTDPEDPSSEPLSIQEGDIEVEIERLDQKGGEKLYLVAYSSIVDLEDENITIEWYIEGIGIIGYGRELLFTTEDKVNEVIMRIRNKDTLIFENTYLVSDHTSDPIENETMGLGVIIGISMFIVMVIILITVTIVIIPKKRKEIMMEGYRAAPNPEDGVLNSPPSVSRPGTLPSPRTPSRIGNTPAIEPHMGLALNPARNEIPVSPFNSIRDDVCSRDLHIDQKRRKEELLDRAKKMHEKGEIDIFEYKSIRESLNYD